MNSKKNSCRGNYMRKYGMQIRCTYPFFFSTMFWKIIQPSSQPYEMKDLVKFLASWGLYTVTSAGPPECTGTLGLLPTNLKEHQFLGYASLCLAASYNNNYICVVTILISINKKTWVSYKICQTSIIRQSSGNHQEVIRQ